MSDQTVQQVRQLSSRLENATSSERIEALEGLQSIAKQSPQSSQLVGEFALKRVLDFLKEQGSSEEYEEALDLIYKLIKNRDKSVAKANTNIVLAATERVELLLDLLEHEDLLIGVMTSQILTELHCNDGEALEAQIQLCPDGMNKLLQRLPDRAREEVRNQALVLVQQLTTRNEEMKKTVAFNEGFEILLGIISAEGGASDVGLVVQDCLQICSNILTDSETCQRLFFSMGGADWVLRLAVFFDPQQLESRFLPDSAAGSALDGSFDGQQPGGGSSWYEQQTRLSCAILALSALYSALSTPNAKHQNLVANGTSLVIPSAAFWVARRGPVQLVNAGLSLLYRAVDSNPEVAERLSREHVKVSPAQVGRNIPFGVESPPLHFSWRPSLEDDRRLVSLMALLAERYVYVSETWFVDDGLQLGEKLAFECSVGADGEAFADGCLRVFEKILSASTDTSDRMLQSVLAPPPPPSDVEDDHHRALETMTPVGTLLLHLLVDGCQKVLNAGHQQQYGMQSGGPYRSDVVVVTERAANVLASVFIFGGELSREFATVLSTNHATKTAGAQAGDRAPPVPLLHHLLSTAGRMARIPNGGGYTVLVAVLRLLSTTVTACEPAVRVMFKDPANLFVVDLATPASESAGVPALVQVASCFFLGCCFQAFAAPTEGDAPASGAADPGVLNQKSFLGMIDSRVGLNRFTEILRRPLQPPPVVAKSHGGGAPAAVSEYAGLFASGGFRVFYEAQVEAIRNGIFDFYAGVGGAGGGSIDAAHQQVMDMQRARIAELEEQLKARISSGGGGGDSDVPAIATSDESGASAEQSQTLRDELTRAKQSEEALTEEKRLNAVELEEARRQCHEHLDTASAAETQRVELEGQVGEYAAACQSLREEQESLRQLLHQSEERAAGFEVAYNHLLEQHREQCGALQEEVTGLKAMLVRDGEDQKGRMEEIAQLGRKVSMLEAAAASSPQAPVDTSALDRKVSELEGRNAELKQQLWAVEAELAASKTELLVTNTVSSSAATTAEDHQGDGHIDQLALEKVTQSVTQLALNLGVEVADWEFVQEQLEAADTTATQRADLLEYLLNQCADAVDSAAGQCSDLAEGARLSNLQGKEGSVERAVDCCRRFSELAFELSARAEEGDRLRVQLADAEADTRDEVSAREKAEADYLELRDEIALLQSQHAELQAQYSQACSECEAVRGELQSRVEKQETTTEQQKEEQQQHDHNLFVRIDHLTQERDALASQVEALNAAFAEERGALSAQVAQLGEQLQSSENRADELARTNASYESALQHVNEQAEETRREVDRLTHSLQMAQSSGDDQLTQYVDQIATLERAESDLAQELRSARERLSEAETARDSLQASLAALRETHDATCTRLVESEGEVLAAQQARDEAHTEAESLQNQLLTSQTEMQTLEGEVLSTQSAAESLQNQLLSARTEMESLQSELLSARADLRTSQNLVVAHDKQDSVVQQAVEGLQRDVERLSAELEQAQAEAADLRGKVASADSISGAQHSDALRQVEELAAQVAALQLQAQQALEAHQEALALERAHAKAVMDKSAELQDQHRSLVEELTAQKAHRAQAEGRLEKSTAVLRTLEAAQRTTEEELAKATAARQQTLVDLEEARAALQRKDKDLAQLREGFEAEKKRIEAHYNAVSANDPFRSQDHELRRLALSADKMSKDLHAREAEVHSLQAQLRRKEGEVAGLAAALQSFESDMDAVRAENEALAAQAAAHDRLTKDLRREIASKEAAAQLERGEVEGLRAQLQSERLKAQFGDALKLQHSGLLESLQKELREAAAWIVRTYDLSPRSIGSEAHSLLLSSGASSSFDAAAQIACLRSLVEAVAAKLSGEATELRTQLEGALSDCEKVKDQVQLLQKQLHQQEDQTQLLQKQLHQQEVRLEQQQTQLQAQAKQQSAVALSDSMRTPAKKAPSVANSSSHSHHDLSGGNGMLTPVQRSSELAVTSRSSSAVKAAQHLNGSPAAKEAARLNAEVLREKRKLSALQEQHTDLLGLLAQQEVEMGVFRQALEAKLSDRELLGVEAAAQRSVIDRYGAYTNFRQCEDGEDVGSGGGGGGGAGEIFRDIFSSGGGGKGRGFLGVV